MVKTHPCKKREIDRERGRETGRERKKREGEREEDKEREREKEGGREKEERERLNTPLKDLTKYTLESYNATIGNTYSCSLMHEIVIPNSTNFT